MLVDYLVAFFVDFVRDGSSFDLEILDNVVAEHFFIELCFRYVMLEVAIRIQMICSVNSVRYRHIVRVSEQFKNVSNGIGVWFRHFIVRTAVCLHSWNPFCVWA